MTLHQTIGRLQALEKAHPQYSSAEVILEEGEMLENATITTQCYNPTTGRYDAPAIILTFEERS